MKYRCPACNAVHETDDPCYCSGPCFAPIGTTPEPITDGPAVETEEDDD